MATAFAGLQFSPSSVGRGTAILLGILGVSVGIRSFLSPASYSEMFGFGPKTSTTLTAKSNPFIPIAGGRAIASSVGLLWCAYLKLDTALAVSLVTAGIVGLIDGLCVLKFTEPIDEKATGDDKNVEMERVRIARQTAWGHWSIISVAVAIGAWMLVNA